MTTISKLENINAAEEMPVNVETGVKPGNRLKRLIFGAIDGLVSLLSDNDQALTKPANKDKIERTDDIEEIRILTNRFLQALRRVQSLPDYEAKITTATPYGHFAARPIIGECSHVNGGIFVGAEPHEAIVVDSSYGLLEIIETQLMSRISHLSTGNASLEHKFVSEVISLVLETMRYDEQGVKDLTEREDIKPDQKVALDIFIKEQVGVARHQVLLAAYLLENLKERQVLNGCLFLDTQMSAAGIEDERLIYTSPNGHLFIFDPGAARRKQDRLVPLAH